MKTASARRLMRAQPELYVNLTACTVDYLAIKTERKGTQVSDLYALGITVFTVIQVSVAATPPCVLAGSI